MSAVGTATNFLSTSTVLSQVTFAVILAIALYIIMFSLESIYISFLNVTGTKVPIEALTVTSDKETRFVTNPNSNNPIYLPPSDNERTGIEFSYTCFLMFKQSTFGTDAGLRHIFHRGYRQIYPLMNPGVFLHNNSNTLRVYQNSSRKWNNYVDVQNIPVDKWFHLVVLARKGSIEIYINANLASKISLVNDAIYQNYQDVWTFVNTVNMNLTNDAVASVPQDDPFTVLKGSPNCLMSRFNYFNYALSYTEIQDLMNEGPNKKIKQDSTNLPPYFIDNWWTGLNNLM